MIFKLRKFLLFFLRITKYFKIYKNKLLLEKRLAFSETFKKKNEYLMIELRTNGGVVSINFLKKKETFHRKYMKKRL